jgi:hypothetical protein
MREGGDGTRMPCMACHAWPASSCAMLGWLTRMGWCWFSQIKIWEEDGYVLHEATPWHSRLTFSLSLIPSIKGKAKSKVYLRLTKVKSRWWRDQWDNIMMPRNKLRICEGKGEINSMKWSNVQQENHGGEDEVVMLKQTRDVHLMHKGCNLTIRIHLICNWIPSMSMDKWK